MKRNYEAPFAEIYLCAEDVITTSGLTTVMGDDNVVSWKTALSKEAFEG